MNGTVISLAIMAGLSGVILGIWNNKDTRGAVTWAWVIALVGYVLIHVSGCAVAPEYRPELQVGMHYQPQGEAHRTFGHNPVGTIRLKQPVWPLPDRMWLEYEHHSSIPDYHDKAVTDQVGVMFSIPLGRDE